MAVDNPGGNPETWAATYGGISVFRNGQWVKYTKTNGLPSNLVYRLARDGSGTIWASTSSGVVKFDGTKFIGAGAPFGTTGVSEKMTADADGNVWMATTSKLYRRNPNTGTWTRTLLDIDSENLTARKISKDVKKLVDFKRKMFYDILL